MGGKQCARCPLSDAGKMPSGGCHKTQEWVDDLVTDYCPVMDINTFSYLFKAFRWAKRGHLPKNLGWDELPISLVDGLEILYDEEEKVTLAAQQQTGPPVQAGA